MKHNVKITVILISMFIITQLIGLAVINNYSPKTSQYYNETTGMYQNVSTNPQLPFGFQPPEMKQSSSLTSIIISFVIAISLIFLLMAFKVKWFLKIWFLFVITVALAITINSILIYFNLSPYYALILAFPFALLKIFKRNMIVHNITELLIYPGIAAVFVPILGIWSTVVLLILISIYDIYAVWHAGFMQKMAKYQINELKIFGGFFIPYMADKDKEKIKLLQQKYKNNIPDKILKSKKIKINLAILGGGDVVFPLILAGVVFVSKGLLPALMITLFSAVSLLVLFILAKKGKFYPAMPFLTSGCLVGLALSYLF